MRDITRFLGSMGAGDAAAEEDLMLMVYAELR